VRYEFVKYFPGQIPPYKELLDNDPARIDFFTNILANNSKSPYISISIYQSSIRIDLLLRQIVVWIILHLS